MVRNYSKSSIPSEVFVDLLNKIGRRGWYKGGPAEEKDFQLVPTISFHMHPDDADRVENILRLGIARYAGNTVWVLQRTSQNRFFLCPDRLIQQGVEEGGLTLHTAANLRDAEPEAGLAANRDLLLLTDCIYNVHKTLLDNCDT